MKTALAWIGLAYVVLTALAMLDVIDFHSCIAGAGKCSGNCSRVDGAKGA